MQMNQTFKTETCILLWKDASNMFNTMAKKYSFTLLSGSDVYNVSIVILTL